MVVALMTDFGTRDPYVAAMKGVIASRCDAAIADLTHEIAPFDAFEAAWFLRAVWRWWPAGTVFVCVVDPGVGTGRRILAGVAEGRFFLAPDNGLLALVDGASCRSVENEAFFPPGGSTTFHGRDRFAPVAAAIANGTALAELGPPAGSIVALDYTPPVYGPDSAQGTIVSIDRFGNCITDLERARIAFDTMRLRAGSGSIGLMRTAYDSSREVTFMIVGSTGAIEISVARGSAESVLGLRRGDRVEVVKT